MAWNLGKVAIVYFMIGALLVTTGQIGLDSAGLVTEVIAEQSVDGDVVMQNTSVGEELSGAPRESQDSVFGGSIIAALQFGRDILAFANWPVALALEQNFPWQIQVFLGLFQFTMIIGFARIVRSSV